MIDILVILDRSGSMQTAKADHEGGLRSFVEDQKKVAGEVSFSLVQFDTESPCEIVYDRVPMADVKDIVLVPRGGTPLLDAIGRAVSHVEAGQHVKPSDSTICMVVTDGEENSSREWTKSRVAERIKALEAKRWTFLFLGAGIDAFAEAGSVGISMAMAAAFDNSSQASVRSMYSTTSSNVMRSRTMSGAGMSHEASASALAYSDEQRDEIKQKEQKKPKKDDVAGTTSDWSALRKP